MLEVTRKILRQEPRLLQYADELNLVAKYATVCGFGSEDKDPDYAAVRKVIGSQKKQLEVDRVRATLTSSESEIEDIFYARNPREALIDYRCLCASKQTIHDYVRMAAGAVFAGSIGLLMVRVGMPITILHTAALVGSAGTIAGTSYQIDNLEKRIDLLTETCNQIPFEDFSLEDQEWRKNRTNLIYKQCNLLN